jgi:hypothetical protein
VPKAVLTIAVRKSTDFMSCILDGNKYLMLYFAVDVSFEEFRVTNGKYVIWKRAIVYMYTYIFYFLLLRT